MRRTVKLLALGSAAALALSACGGGSGGGSGGDGDGGGTITIGTTLSMSGALGVLGAPLKAGYQQAIKDVNADGGIEIDGKKRKLKLVVLDNASDPNKASTQARELVLKDKAVGLLGFTTPPIVLPVGLAAEQLKVPFVTSLTPVQAFQNGNKSGWKYGWDFFFNETDQAKSAAEALAKADSNKKVVVFTDNEPDGVLERPLYKAALKTAGLDVVGDYTFPVGTTDFSSFITDAKSKGAQLVAGQMTPADGIALWKQLKSFKLDPQAAFLAKASDSPSWWSSLSTIAEGTLSEGFWSKDSAPKDALAKIMPSLGEKYADSPPDLASSSMAYSAAKVLTDAIAAAGSTDPEKINDAVAKTDADYPGGHISFDAKTHTAVTGYYITQWQQGKLLQVLPPVSGVSYEQPTKGLQ